MGLYKIQNTEITGNGYPKTGMLSVQTGNPWNYTVWTPNGDPIITDFIKDVTKIEDPFEGGPLTSNWDDYSPTTLAVSNNFWADLTDDPSDLKEPIKSLKRLEEAVMRYILLLQNRFDCANVGPDVYVWYPIVIDINRLQREIRFYLNALKQAKEILEGEQSQGFIEKLAKVDSSKFTGPGFKEIIKKFEEVIGVGGITSVIPGVGGEWGVPLINDASIEGKDVPAIWNAFLALIKFDGIGFDLEEDYQDEDDYALRWQGVTTSFNRWPVDGWDDVPRTPEE